MEGGIGLWIGTKFPSTTPLFRVNATPNCYLVEIGSPGWAFHAQHRLVGQELGLAQLTNRILLPPDGVSFAAVTHSTIFGHGWIALPLIAPHTPTSGPPVGGQSWTLFFNAANFKGPVAFFVPDVWTSLSATYAPDVARGHDVRPAEIGGVAIEIGQTSAFTATATSGVQYRRIPRLTFDADNTGRAVLLQDVRLYSKSAIWNAVAQWIQNGIPTNAFDPAGIFSPTISGAGAPLTSEGDPVTLTGDFYAGTLSTSAGTPAFGFQWSGALEPGVLPEYFRKEAAGWRPIPASDVPADTRLSDQTFPLAQDVAIEALDTSEGSPWDSSKWAAGPFTAYFDDSTVQYVWYKFIDQPAIARLGLQAGELQRLQAFVESLHQNAGVNGPAMLPPSSGTLAALHSGVFVAPPLGLERGYVPIAIGQYYRVTKPELAALGALYHSTNGGSWTHATNWMSWPMSSAWYGTMVDIGVTELNLLNNNLTGQLPQKLGDLTALRSVELSSNHVSGPLPSTLGQLTHLTFFSAYNNALTGPLPSIPALSQLQLLQLGRNQLSGPIPSSFGALTSLQYLFLSQNQLSGAIPSELGQLTQLRQLDLSQNSALSGPLPVSLTNLHLLDTLRFDGTNICVPADAALNSWLNSIPTVTRSGLTCP